MNFTYETDKHIKVVCKDGNINIGKSPDQKEEPGFFLYNTIVQINMLERQIKTLLGQISGTEKKVLGYTEIMDKGIEQSTANKAMREEVERLRGIVQYLASTLLPFLANMCNEKYQQQPMPLPDQDTAPGTPQTTPISSAESGQSAL